MLKVVKNIDEKTGELLSDRQSYYESVFTEEGYKVPYHKAGTRMFDDVQFPKDMSDADIGKLTRLSKLMISTSNMLGYRAKGSILAYSEEHIINVTGLSQKRGKEFIQRMIGLGAMQRVVRMYGDIESTEYYINPAYFFAGKRVGLNLYLLFREHLDPILPKWVKNEYLKLAATFSTKAVTKD